MVAAGDKIRASDIIQDTGVRVRRTANQSINSATDTAVSWDTEDEDTDGFFTPTSATITIPTGLGGHYAITAWVLSGTTLAGRCYIEITPTSAVTGLPANIRMPIIFTSEARMLVSATIPLLAADTFQIHLLHTIGAASNFTGWLSCRRVAP